MSLNPNRLALLRQHKFIPVSLFQGYGPPTITIVGGDASITAIGLADDAADSALAKTAATNRIGATGVQPPASAQTGLPVLKEIGTTGVMGLLMEAANDAIAHFMEIPTHWDQRHDIDARIIWCSEAAAVGNRTVTWKVSSVKLTPGTTALSAALAIQTFAAQAPVGTAKTVERSATKKTILARAAASLSSPVYLRLQVDMSAFHADFTEDKYLMGIEFEYSPILGRSLRHRGRAWKQDQT